MKTFSRGYSSKYINSKHLNELKDVILQHIKINIKDYLILSIVFIIGVMLGVVLINNSDEGSKTEIKRLYNKLCSNNKK